MNLAMDQFEALQDMVASSADNTISSVDEEVEDAMRTAAWNKAEAEWQAEKEDC